MESSLPSLGTPSEPARPPYPWQQYTAVPVLAAVLVFAICLRYQEVIADAHASFVAESMAESTALARTTEGYFNRLYHSLRTMARLPMIQAIDSNAKNLSADERTTIQEVYNNLAKDVVVSEVSIYLDGFHAEAIDPATKVPQQPTVTFDELIVGRPAAQQAGPAMRAAELNVQKRRLIENQIEIIKARYPLRSSFPTLDNPAISGPEIAIRVSRDASLAGLGGKDQKGIVYSIPFYGVDGNFRGVISAAISTATLKSLMPNELDAIVNSANGFSTFSNRRTESLRADEVDVVPMNIRDVSGAWSLHAVHDEAAFFAGADALVAEYVVVAELIFVVFLAGVLLYAIGTHYKSLCQAANRQSELDRLVRERTFELEGERQKFLDFAETTSDWFWETDENLVIRDVSGAFSEATGIAKETIIGQNLASLTPSDQHAHLADDARERLESLRDLRNFYVMIASPTRGQVYLRMAARAVRSDAGEFAGYRGTSSDITAGLARARAAQQGQKLQALGSMAAGLAHEFNNILSIVLGYTESLKNTYRRDADTVDQLGHIAEAGRRGTMLSKSLLSFGRTARSSREVFNARALGVELPQLLKPLLGAGCALKVETVDRPLWIDGERDLLTQSIVNLVLNARDSMPHGGTVTLSFGVEPPHSDRLTRAGLTADVEYGVITIADAGEGMDRETARKLFEPSFSSKRADRGIGLSVVGSLVDSCKAHIDVQSEPGRGTAISIILPLSNAPAARKFSARGEAMDFAGLRVLLVDDEPQLVAIFATMLRSLGFDVVAHTDLDAALEVLDDESQKIDLIVSDVLMPQMSGFRFADLARSLRQSIEVLFVSGQPERGGDDADPVPKDAKILGKPFDRDQLSAAINELLATKIAA